MSNKEETYKPENSISNVGLYSILVGGFVIFFAGVYVSSYNNVNWDAPGWDREFGPIHLNGPFLIVLGILFLIYPAYQLRKRSKQAIKKG